MPDETKPADPTPTALDVVVAEVTSEPPTEAETGHFLEWFDKNPGPFIYLMRKQIDPWEAIVAIKRLESLEPDYRRAVQDLHDIDGAVQGITDQIRRLHTLVGPEGAPLGPEDMSAAAVTKVLSNAIEFVERKQSEEGTDREPSGGNPNAKLLDGRPENPMPGGDATIGRGIENVGNLPSGVASYAPTGDELTEVCRRIAMQTHGCNPKNTKDGRIFQVGVAEADAAKLRIATGVAST